MRQEPLFRSFFLGGFESSTHRQRNGTRLDLLAATEHDRYAAKDYHRLQALGVSTVRDAFRWHRIERAPGRYDFSSVLPMLRAARATGTQVIWDLCHYGWPDDLDIFRPEFVRRFAAYARAVAEVVAHETETPPFYAPINEISFWAWAGGEVGYMNPWQHERGFELKVQLVRATVEAIEAIWSVDPRARMLHVDPLIHIIADPMRPADTALVRGLREHQFQAWDMLNGSMWPQLGGAPKYLDIVGVNYYEMNQWIHNGPQLTRAHPSYRRLRHLLREVAARYRRPLVITETGIEDGARPDWLRYVGREARAAMRQGVPLEGICWYPIVNHPGWDDDRHCHNGLFDYPDACGERIVYEPLARELRAQQRHFARPDQRTGTSVANPWRQPATALQLSVVGT